MIQLHQFSADAWVETADRGGATHAMLVPTMLGRVLDVMERRAVSLPKLRHLSYGGGRMPATLIERALERLPHVDFVNAYGLTETSSTIAVLTPDDHRTCTASDDPAVRRRLGSVGRHGWMDDGGYLFVEGRLDDVIVRGGENISPGEVEDVLRLHDAVADVAVLGVPDDEWGEKVVAVVVTRTPVEGQALSDWVRARLRSTKAPEQVRFRDALPYNETGKLLRRRLKAEFISMADA